LKTYQEIPGSTVLKKGRRGILVIVLNYDRNDGPWLGLELPKPDTNFMRKFSIIAYPRVTMPCEKE